MVHLPEPASKCPETSRWEELVSGLILQKEADAMLQHAGHCDRCGTMLRTLTEAVMETDGDDEKILAGLASSQAAWQADLGRRLARGLPRRIETRRPVRRWWPTAAAAAAALLLASGLFWRWQSAGVPADQLLAQAYEQGRPFEYRLRDAAHGPVRLERGTVSAVPGSKALVEARAVIAEKLAAGAPAPDLLRQKGEAELLALETAAAIETLRLARERAPGDQLIAESLAIAIAVRAPNRGDPAASYNEALGLLSGVPSLAGRYNRALLLERLGRLSEARTAWDEVARLEPDPAWKREAEAHRK